MLPFKILVLKLSMLKKIKQRKKQCVAIIYYNYKRKLSLFGRGDTKQAKNLIFIVVPPLFSGL